MVFVMLLVLPHVRMDQADVTLVRRQTPFECISADCRADTKAWEVDTLRGHVNNVSCVIFHARQVSGRAAVCVVIIRMYSFCMVRWASSRVVDACAADAKTMHQKLPR